MSVTAQELSREELEAKKATLAEELRMYEEMVAAFDEASTITTEEVTEVTPGKKVLKKKKVKVRKSKKAQKKAKKAKGKKKGKGKKGLAAIGAGITAAAVAGRKQIVRGAKAVARGSRRVGRKMWAAAIGAGKWIMSGVRYAGRSIAGMGKWLLATGARVLNWGLGVAGTGWMLVSVAGIIVITLVAWGITAGSRGLSRVADGKKAAKRRKLSAKKRLKLLKRAQKSAQKRADLFAKEAAKLQKKTAPKKTEKVVAETETVTTSVTPTKEVTVAKKTTVKKTTAKKAPAKKLTFAEVDTEIKTDQRTINLVKQVVDENYEGLELAQVVHALSVHTERLDEDGADKETYGYARGRFEVAAALEDEELDRGRQLYEKLRKKVTETFGAADATMDERAKEAAKKIHWGKFQSGVVKEQELLAGFKEVVVPV